MTIITWDGKSIAADRLVVRGDTRMYTKKLHRRRNFVIAAAGPSDYAAALEAWWLDGKKIDFYPTYQTKDDYAVLVVAGPDRFLECYDRTPYPLTFDMEFFAIGSGREAALGAFAMGADAEQAALVACNWIEGCGGGVDVERLV